jgi:hypothetical protein
VRWYQEDQVTDVVRSDPLHITVSPGSASTCTANWGMCWTAPSASWPS